MNAYTMLSLGISCYMEAKSVPKQTKIRIIANCTSQVKNYSWLSCNAEDGPREGASVFVFVFG